MPKAIGGTTGASDDHECTTNYRAANQHLQPGSWVPVCYPASAGPWLNGHGGVLDLNAPSYDDSTRTIAEGGRDGIQWRNPDGSPA
ncbi:MULTISPECIES: hypothetical protein [unclassified Streptomyces]|uniref:hypothetical protein n=1 Tax=unclassified Streptomyces TaxID=2593676 RepID=UPI0003692706|nr:MULTISPECIES: hypothetical protein [unclassified Streptomyces]MYT32632.1 hypothetical protein [Streptomyces sp. SID8354]